MGERETCTTCGSDIDGRAHHRLPMPTAFRTVGEAQRLADVARLCQLQAEVSRHIGDGSARDCFCNDVAFGGLSRSGEDLDMYRNEGHSLDFIVLAVRNAMGAEADSEKQLRRRMVGSLMQGIGYPDPDERDDLPLAQKIQYDIAKAIESGEV